MLLRFRPMTPRQASRSYGVTSYGVFLSPPAPHYHTVSPAHHNAAGSQLARLHAVFQYHGHTSPWGGGSAVRFMFVVVIVNVDGTWCCRVALPQTPKWPWVNADSVDRCPTPSNPTHPNLPYPGYPLWEPYYKRPPVIDKRGASFAVG